MSVLLFSVCEISAQNTNNPTSIKAIARAAGDSIVLRWAPSSPTAWSLLNKYGYRIERFTVTRDNQVLDNKSQIVLTPNPVKPMPETEWKKYIDTDDFVAVAAQSIFGDSLIHEKGRQDVMQMIQKANELEMRYSYTLFASEISPRAGTLAGLRFVDRTADKREKYLYRIYPVVPANVASIEFGFVYIGLSDYQPLPVPPTPTVSFGDATASITWPVYMLRDVYTGYYVEKSTDGGKTFKRVNTLPHVATFNDQEDQLHLTLTKHDSLSSNGVLTHYRIVGVSSFGELGPPSQLVSGQGVAALKDAVSQVKGLPGTAGSATISWEFPTSGEKNITAFEIERSKSADGGFINIGKVSNQTRKYVDSKPLPVNYYRIVTLGKDKTRKKTFPILVQLEDSIPPLAPQLLKATVDTTGIVTLSWQPNQEPDLLGYRIFRSNFSNSEFSLVTKAVISAPRYTDTINIKTLTGKVFYRIVAVDFRYNPSPFSQTLEVIKPDIIPPVPPVIQSVKIDPAGILITWFRSSSEDVAGYQLWRRTQPRGQWSLVKKFTEQDTSYTDSPEDKSQRYEYKMNAFDKKGLVSSNTPTISGKVAPANNAPAVKNLKGQADRSKKEIRIQWNDDRGDVVKFLIYRQSADEPISLYRTVPAQEKVFVDKNLQSNTAYTYRVKAVLNSGAETLFSEALKISY